MNLNNDESVSDFKKKADRLTLELERISKLTAKIGAATMPFQSNIQIPKGTQSLKNMPFCRSTKPCADKWIRTTKRSKRGKSNLYRACLFKGACNQQTAIKDLAAATVTEAPNGLRYYK